MNMADAKIPWRHFWHLLCFQPWTYLLVLVTKLLFITLLPQATGLLTRQFFDSLTGNGSLVGGINGLVWLFIGIGVARAVAIVVDVVGNRLFRHPLGALLRKNILTHLFARPAAQALRSSPSETVSHLRDDVIVTINALYTTTFLVAHLLFALIAVVVMVRINPWVTALGFGPLIGVVLIANRVRQRVEQLFQSSRAATDTITNFLGEIFGAVQAVQIASAEAHVLAQFQTLNEQRQHVMVRSRLLNALLEAVFRNITSLGAGLILLVAARSLQMGTFTVGDFVLFAFYLEAINETVHIIGLTLTELRQARISFGRLADLLPGTPAAHLVAHGPVYQSGPRPVVVQPVKTPSDRLAALEVQALHYHYPGSERGIHNISFTLPRGSLTIITGAMGAGKTTLLKVLLGLLPHDRGAIYWNGERILDPATVFVPPRVAYTAQVPRLFSDTLRENILLGWPAPESALAHAIQTAVLEPDLAQLAQGLATPVGPRGVKLSGGQVQRAAAARMLVRTPELLVFDDLASALDGETERRLWENLLQQKTAFTVLAVSQQPLALHYADQIIVMQAGQHVAASH